MACVEWMITIFFLSHIILNQEMSSLHLLKDLSNCHGTDIVMAGSGWVMGQIWTVSVYPQYPLVSYILYRGKSVYHCPLFVYYSRYIIHIHRFTVDPNQLKQPNNYTHICIFLHFKIYNEFEELYMKESNMFDKKYIFVILHENKKPVFLLIQGRNNGFERSDNINYQLSVISNFYCQISQKGSYIRAFGFLKN